MSTLRTYNVQSSDSASTNIQLTENGGIIVAGVSTFSNNLITDGRIGIGTDNPNDSLTILKDATGAGAGGLKLQTAGSNESYLTFGVSSSLSKAIFTSSFNGSGTALPMVFAVGPSSTDERLRISSTGLVSIPVSGVLQVGGAGSAETDSKLYVANTGGNAYIQVKGADSTGIAGLKFGRNSVANRAGIDWSAATDNLTIRTGGTNPRITVSSGGNVGMGTDNPTAKLDVNGTLNVTGVSTFQDNVNLGDNNKIILGDGDDLQLYHTSTNSYIDDTATGNLNIRSNGSFINLGTISGETMISAKTNGNVELFYDNSKKFETTSSGVSITGNIDVDNTTSIGSATSSLSTLTQTAIHTELAVATYRSVEYTIQATQGTNFHATKILALHNGTTAYHSEYGTIFNNSSVASFDVDISGGNLRLLATGASASQTDYVVNFVATKV